jgi:preprotein translocase subunit Sec61beta
MSKPAKFSGGSNRSPTRCVSSLIEVTSAGLMLVRYFDDEEGGGGALGWALSPEQVGLLASMGAEIQAGEYGG